jgi:hypothetical protein
MFITIGQTICLIGTSPNNNSDRLCLQLHMLLMFTCSSKYYPGISCTYPPTHLFHYCHYHDLVMLSNIMQQYSIPS